MPDNVEGSRTGAMPERSSVQHRIIPEIPFLRPTPARAGFSGAANAA